MGSKDANQIGTLFKHHSLPAAILCYVTIFSTIFFLSKYFDF